MEKRDLKQEETSKSTMLLAVHAETDMAMPSIDIYAPQDGRSPQAMPRIRFHANAVNPHFGDPPLPPRGVYQVSDIPAWGKCFYR